ncbi:MAG TPA: carboxypeptidase-like regulatory domain-containing protein [Pyrinomonadaceae bacterium]|nr:carboxypeptidase-like regulatory domain-containing protein [Pyrinomonadaceae bacterium]
MTERADILGRVRVASPCRANWERMEGDERVRFCRECNLNVYNLSGMTRREAASLVAETEGRLCARFFRRADGTVLTKDCPTGLRAVRRRVSLAAGAAFAAVLSLFAVASGKPHKQKKSCSAGEVKIQNMQAINGHSSFSGVAADPNGAVIVGADVVLTNESTRQKFKATTSSEGEFVFPQLAAGKYTLEASSPGFKHLIVEHLELHADETVRVEASLQVATEMMTMGVIAIDEPLHDNGYTTGVTVLDSKTITRLPH